MANGDMVSMVLVGVALLMAATISILMLVSARSRARATSPAPQPLTVRLVPNAETELGYRWRFVTAAGAPPTVVDIFSFRPCGEDQAGPWRHELMNASLVLAPAQPIYLRAGATVSSTAYDVIVGWTIRRADADIQGSAVMTIEPEPTT